MTIYSLDDSVEPTHWKQLLSGGALDLVYPSLRDLPLHDILVPLTRIPRFLGHTRVPYSVADHSLHCLDIARRHMGVTEIGEHLDVRTQITLACVLTHDFHEVFIGDLPAPWKPLLGEAWKAAEERMAWAVAGRFSLPHPYPEDIEAVVKRADLTALSTEYRDLLARPSIDWNGALPEPDWRTVSPQSPAVLIARMELYLERLGCIAPEEKKGALPS